MNARVDHLLDEVLDLPADERSAIAMALIDSLAESDQRVVSESWRAELRLRRERLREGATTPAPWSEARARIAGW